MISLAFYLDASLNLPADGALVLQHVIGGDEPEAKVYLGSAVANRQFSNNAAPTEPIQVLVAGGVGGPWAAADFVLAATQAGLDAATPGQLLPIDGPILSGSANAVSFWMRFVADPANANLQSDLRLETNELLEEATA